MYQLNCNCLRSVPFILLAILTATVHSADRPKISSSSDVKKIVDYHFNGLSSHTKGDVITQKQVKSLFKKLEEFGWKVPYQKEILERILKDGDFLPQVLSTQKGREFLTKIKQYPDGIDRLDRMSRLPNGEASVTDLINKIPNGHEWIEAMTLTKRGKILGERLSKSDKGKDFNEPTDRYYFVEDLSKVLETIYEKTASKLVKRNRTIKGQQESKSSPPRTKTRTRPARPEGERPDNDLK